MRYVVNHACMLLFNMLKHFTLTHYLLSQPNYELLNPGAKSELLKASLSVTACMLYKLISLKFLISYYLFKKRGKIIIKCLNA